MTKKKTFLQPILGETHQPHFLVHPSVTTTVNQSCQEAEKAEWLHENVLNLQSGKIRILHRGGKTGRAVHLITQKQSHSECNTEQLLYNRSPWLAPNRLKCHIQKSHSDPTCHTRPHITIQYKYSCRYKHACQIIYQQLDANWPRQTGWKTKS